MTSIKVTLLDEQGEPMEDGSAEVVASYLDLLREARDKLLEARQLIGHLPEPVEAAYRVGHDKAARALDKHLDPIARFSHDYDRRGLESAVGDAIHRKEPPWPGNQPKE